MQHLPALRIEHLSFSYGSKKALDDVSFSVQAGRCSLLLGENGAGKSTLFSLITRLYDSVQGCIELGGFNIKTQANKALSQLGVVFQQSTLDLDLSVQQNLRYHASLQGMAKKLANKRIEEELERLQMLERRYEKVRQLNGGHRRRVEIARALLHKPKLLLLDEPTVGLDMSARQRLVAYIHELAQRDGLAILWATHLVDEVLIDDDLIVLHRAQIKAAGTVSALLQRTGTTTVHQAFNALITTAQ